jgi:ParB/RepB/Spo0J family partition protein
MIISDIPINKIRSKQNIRIDSNEGLEPLMQSIKQHGLQTPIGVYEDNNEYIVVWGNRRISACKKLGWSTIPARVIDGKENILIQNTIENVQRKDITPAELGRICKEMKDTYNLSYKEIAVVLSTAPTTIEKCVKLFEKMPVELISEVSHQNRNRDKIGVSVSNASKMIRLMDKTGMENKENIKQLFNLIKREDLNSIQMEAIGKLVKYHGYSIAEAFAKIKTCTFVSVAFVIETSSLQSYKHVDENCNIQGIIRKIIEENSKLKFVLTEPKTGGK